MTVTCSSDKHARLNLFTSEFASPEAEAGFLCKQLASNQRQLRRSLAFCSIFYIAFALTDVSALGYGRDAFVLFLMRMSVALTALGGIWFSRANPGSTAAARAAASVVEAMGMVTFLVIVSYRPDEMLLHGMSMTIMLIIVYIFIPNRLVYATGIAFTATAAFLAAATAFGNLKPSDLLSTTMLLLLANVFGLAAARRYERLSRIQFHAQQTLTNISVRDHLTGCFNRRHLNERLLDAEISRSQRYRLNLTLVMCDLDRFKSINDTLGHQAGDRVLCAFANLLTAMTRDGVDAVVRYGGEEFLVILPETGLQGGIEFAERVRTRFEDAAQTHDGSTPKGTTASFGVVSVDFAAVSLPVTQQVLIGHADALMYEAKKGGRNQVRSLALL